MGTWRSGPLVVAHRFRDRLRGIRIVRDGRGMLLRARSVHTFGLPGAIRITGLGPGGEVRWSRTVPPRRVVFDRRTVWIAETSRLGEIPAAGRVAYARRVAGTLILCAGPIGNLGDAPPRLAESLAAAGVVYAEDTRRARTLLNHLGVDRPLRSFFVGNEANRAVEIRDRLAAGETVALVTDAGTPGIADPGLTAVRAALEAGAEVTGVPGPSAVTLALAVAGLPADRFVFEGFLPRRGSRRSARIAGLRDEDRTAVLFCAPSRLGRDLTDLAAVLGPDRPAVVCRELTKLHEEVWRGDLAGAAAHWGDRKVRGEVTLVLGGAVAAPPDLESAAERAAEMVESGMTVAEASRLAARETGAPRRQIYDRIVGNASRGPDPDE